VTSDAENPISTLDYGHSDGRFFLSAQNDKCTGNEVSYVNGLLPERLGGLCAGKIGDKACFNLFVNRYPASIGLEYML
jgi:hypothetical protein